MTRSRARSERTPSLFTITTPSTPRCDEIRRIVSSTSDDACVGKGRGGGGVEGERRGAGGRLDEIVLYHSLDDERSRPKLRPSIFLFFENTLPSRSRERRAAANVAPMPRSMHSMELLNSLYGVGESYHATDPTPGRDHIQGTIHKETAAALLASDWARTGVPESYGRMDLQHVLSCQDWPLHCSKGMEGFQEPIVVMPLKANAASTMEGVELSHVALRPARFDFVGPPRRGFIVVCAEALKVEELVMVNDIVRATPRVQKVTQQDALRDADQTRMSAQDAADEATALPPLQYGRFMIEITALQEPPQEQLHFLVDDPVVALDRPAIFNPSDDFI